MLHNKRTFRLYNGGNCWFDWRSDHVNAIEQQILEKVSGLELEQKQRVLAFVEQIATQNKQYTALELMQLPFEERNTILQAQLAQAADEDFETFEAYSDEDLHDTPSPDCC